ncbi:hypothetical protein CANMA_000829 [Candida margitis]|uniref:uncharacterized protein n=1 Tax=Candida margitis TaxID=1775924 RepID=UPI00222671C8|nr:uncharacterized protein CANMA_000829 [Candida margitis]KAI5970217.1 hypothetical protein CANMA_000829 [Candida margitis]
MTSIQLPYSTSSESSGDSEVEGFPTLTQIQPRLSNGQPKETHSLEESNEKQVREEPQGEQQVLRHSTQKSLSNGNATDEPAGRSEPVSYFDMIFGSGSCSRSRKNNPSFNADQSSPGVSSDSLVDSSDLNEYSSEEVPDAREGRQNRDKQINERIEKHLGLKGEDFDRRKISRQDNLLKHKQSEQIEHRRCDRMEIKPAKFEEKAQKQAIHEEQRQNKLEDRLKKRIAKLEGYLENIRLKKRLDRDAIMEELDNWRLELNKPRQDRISLLEFKEKSEQKLKSSKIVAKPNDGSEPESQKPQDVEEVSQDGTFLIDRKRKRTAQAEEKRQQKRTKGESNTQPEQDPTNSGDASTSVMKNNDDGDNDSRQIKERPLRQPNVNYVKFYNRFVCETFDPTKCIPELPLSSSKINYGGSYPNESKYPGQFWSGAEKELFFTLLARYSIHQLDMISLSMCKSELEITTYYNLLKRELENLKKKEGVRRGYVTGLKECNSRLVQYGEIPAAYEMSKYFIKYEDEQSMLMGAEGNYEAVTSDEVSVDNDDASVDDTDTLINRSNMSTMFGKCCDDELCQVLENLVKKITKDILINIVNTKTKKPDHVPQGVISRPTELITILPRNIKSSITQLGYSRPNTTFNFDKPLVKKVYSNQYGHRRWFNNITNITSVPAFGNLIRKPNQRTIPTIHNLHQYQNGKFGSVVDGTLDEDFESKLIRLETKEIDDHDVLESRMYEHGLLFMLLDGETEIFPGDIRRLNQWEKELNKEEKDSKRRQGVEEKNNYDGITSEDGSEDENEKMVDLLKTYSRHFSSWVDTDEEKLVEMRAVDEYDNEYDESHSHKEESSESSSGSDDEDNDRHSMDDYNDDNADTNCLFDGFFIRSYK